ncbi:MAG TPA: TMEM175 family protein [Thermoanaerobaculia bacterium]|nr:TMEM175 family protein [Thermoanaerobaculia bacterium]
MTAREQAPLEADRHFRWRGGNVSRIEGLSDGVFGLAVALLAFAQRAPADYADLVETFRELPAFVLSCTFLLWCWYLHYKFFRRFGLQDMLTIVLNGALLLFLLFFVYPLRFLANYLVTGPLFYGGMGRGPVGDSVANLGQGPELMLFYAGSFTLLFLCFALLNLNGYRKREALGLDPAECHLALADVRSHFISLGIGVLSLAFALAGQRALSGLVFFLMGPLHGAHGWWSGSRFEKLRRAGAPGVAAGG